MSSLSSVFFLWKKATLAVPNHPAYLCVLLTAAMTALLMETPCNAQDHVAFDHAGGKTRHVQQWQVVDIRFVVNKEIQSPFDAKPSAIVSADSDGAHAPTVSEDSTSGKPGTTTTSPRLLDSSREQAVPLFYNGVTADQQHEWILRYSSSAIGRKHYVIRSQVQELDGRTGHIEITPNQKLDRHGAIVLRNDIPNRFFYEDGTHYLNLAFECDWLFALDYGQADIPKTKHLLKLLNKYRFNQVVMNVYSYDVKWPKDERLQAHPEHEYGSRDDIFPFLGSNTEPDFTSLNVEFFQHFDRVIAEMHAQEIVSHLMIYVWNKRVSWPEMNSAADNRYYDYVVKRYQAFPNIMWDVSKEALHHGRATRPYIVERIERTRRIDTYDRLVSVHDYGFCRKHPKLVDFISMQNWKHTLHEHMLDAAIEFPDKPIFNIEHGGYEESPYVVFPGAYTNAEVCLRRNYMCLFAGGYTTYYWQGAAWNAVIHNPFEQPANFKRPHFEYFQHLSKLCELARFEHCRPTPHFNSSGYSLTNEKAGIVLLYTPKENHYIGGSSLAKSFDVSDATRQWFNTLTGELTKEERYQPITFWDDRPWRYEADAVLIIRRLKPLPR